MRAPLCEDLTVEPRVAGSNPVAHPKTPSASCTCPYWIAAFLFPVSELGTTGNRSPKYARSKATAASRSDCLEVCVGKRMPDGLFGSVSAEPLMISSPGTEALIG